MNRSALSVRRQLRAESSQADMGIIVTRCISSSGPVAGVGETDSLFLLPVEAKPAPCVQPSINQGLRYNEAAL
mgnify:CR=1 FL=1